MYFQVQVCIYMSSSPRLYPYPFLQCLFPVCSLPRFCGGVKMDTSFVQHVLHYRFSSHGVTHGLRECLSPSPYQSPHTFCVLYRTPTPLLFACADLNPGAGTVPVLTMISALPAPPFPYSPIPLLPHSPTETVDSAETIACRVCALLQTVQVPLNPRHRNLSAPPSNLNESLYIL
jgi:hypothetical protein